MSKSRLIELLLWLVVNQILFMEIYNYVLSPLLRREFDTSLLPNIFSANKMSPLQSYDKSYYCSLYPSECSQVQCGIRAYNETAVYVTTQNNSLVMSDMGSYRFPISLFPSLSVLDNPLPIANSLSSLSFPAVPKSNKRLLIILTTCNHLSYSILSLAAISRNDKSAYDLLIIDDHSTDGTQLYLRKHVLRNCYALELTCAL